MTNEEARTLKVGDEVIFLKEDDFLFLESKKGDIRNVYESIQNDSKVIRLSLKPGESNAWGYFIADIRNIALHRRAGVKESVERTTNIIKKTIMDIRQTFKNLFISEEQKMFRKLGIVSDDGSLTPDGREIYIQHLFNNDKAFVEVAKRMLAEKKGDKED